MDKKHIRYSKRQKEALKVARELQYSNEVILKIKNTKDTNQIDRILRKARLGE